MPMRRPRVLEKAPQSGDFLVQPAFPGFAISKKTDQPGALWQRVADEENRIRALEIRRPSGGRGGHKGLDLRAGQPVLSRRTKRQANFSTPPARRPSSCLSQNMIWFELAQIWSTKRALRFLRRLPEYRPPSTDHRVPISQDVVAARRVCIVVTNPRSAVEATAWPNVTRDSSSRSSAATSPCSSSASTLA